MSDAPQMPEPAGMVADAVRGNWVDRLAPAATRPYLRLSRADRPIGTWLLLLPCWWGVALAAAADPGGWRLADLWIILGCGIGAFLMRGEAEGMGVSCLGYPSPSNHDQSRRHERTLLLRILPTAVGILARPQFNRSQQRCRRGNAAQCQGHRAADTQRLEVRAERRVLERAADMQR